MGPWERCISQLRYRFWILQYIIKSRFSQFHKPEDCVILFEELMKQCMEFSIRFPIHKNVIRVTFPLLKL